jgi:phosphoglycerol transferase MdoB-like AlkP superfamily enzyme
VICFLLPLPIVMNYYFQATLKFLFVTVNSLSILVNLVDIAYFPFIRKRMQADALLFITGQKGTEFFYLLPRFLVDYWYLWCFFILAIFILWITYNTSYKLIRFQKISWRSYTLSVILFFGTVAVFVVGARGGFQLKPLNIIHASEMASPENAPFVLNTPFTIIKTIGKRSVIYRAYLDDDLIISKNETIHYPATADTFTRENVCIIIVESLSKEYMGYFTGNHNTPFLDSLLTNSLVFTDAYANAKESIQGIPAILASIPAWQDEPFIFSPYAANSITSVPTLLKKTGYRSHFFHGASKGSMGFDSFCASAGFDNYYSRESYNNDNDFDGEWGIWDELFLRYAANTLNKSAQPFVAAIFTLNLHHPFKIPQVCRNQFENAQNPVLASVQYTDWSLKHFFRLAQDMPWYKNTLFVIAADHTGPALKNNQPLLDDYRIPIAFFRPGKGVKGINNKIANQIDILPSIMHMLNYPYPYFSMGKNLFKSEGPSYSINYRAGIYQYIDSTYCYQFNGEKGIGLYKWADDPLMKNNLFGKAAMNSTWIKYDTAIKKVAQIHNNAMVNNQLVYQPAQ